MTPPSQEKNHGNSFEVIEKCRCQQTGDTSDEMVIAVAAVTVGYSSACATAPLGPVTKGYGYESD